jgi:hypothetical protein
MSQTSNTIIALFFIVGTFSLIAWMYNKASEQNVEAYKKLNEQLNSYLKKYNALGGKKVLCENSNGLNTILDKERLYTFVDGDKLSFISQGSLTDFGKVSIKLKDVIFFARHGDFYTNTLVTGGGSSIAGAITGSIIAGDVGAIVGSRKEIKSTIVNVDKRQTILHVIHDGKEYYLYFSSESYESFLSIIPQKLFDICQNNQVQQSSNSQESDVYTQITKLSELKDQGILTEEEFSNKKRQLLDKIY